MESEETDFKRLKKNIAEDLSTNPRYNDFWSVFKLEQQKNTFIDYYSHKKAIYLTVGKEALEEFDKTNEQIQDKAMDYLMIIKQKKLYDLQCLWRANKIKVNEVHLTRDFDKWENNIKSCPVPIEITEDDVNILCDFIEQYGHFFVDIEFLEWQEFPFPGLAKKEIPETFDNPYDAAPYWYRFYNNKMGISDEIYSLPDTRGEMEAYYRHVFFEHQNNKPVSTVVNNINNENGIYEGHDSYDRASDEFMDEFEDPALKDYKSAYHLLSEAEKDHRYEEALEILMSANETVPMVENKNWMEGFVQAANTYWKKEMVNAVKSAFWLYKSADDIKLKIVDDNKKEDDWADFIERVSKEIIEGRKILGEPADLNF